MQIVNKKQNGFVSIFVVIFSAVLISVVAIGFIRIMISDQQQATTNDLSRSAYDSALAGVEDAKRALIKYQSTCPNNEKTPICSDLRAAIESDSCNDSVRTLADVNGVFESDDEGTVKTGDNNSLDQAYTCVKIKMNTDNYLGSLSQDAYKMISLSAAGDFNTVQIDWFSADDASSNTIDLNNDKDDDGIPLFTNWSQNTPPVMRAQFIQFAKSNFSLSELNRSISITNNNTGANTLFLYPSQTGSDGKNLAIDGRGELTDSASASSASPQLIKCSDIDSGNLYSCSVLITLPTTIKPSDQAAFLNLSAFYNKADYKVTLLNVASGASSTVQFNGVQPEVDSTGRANDLFRRVKTRIELVDPSYPYPEAAVDITGSLCKTFSVTDTSYNSGSCAGL